MPALAMVALIVPTGAGQARPRAVSASTCIDADRIVSRAAIAPDTIEFRLPRGVTYRSTLPQNCPHLADLDRTYVLSFDNRNGRRICGGDRFRLIDPVAARAGGGAGFPYCRFGSFVRVPEPR